MPENFGREQWFTRRNVMQKVIFSEWLVHWGTYSYAVLHRCALLATPNAQSTWTRLSDIRTASAPEKYPCSGSFPASKVHACPASLLPFSPESALGGPTSTSLHSLRLQKYFLFLSFSGRLSDQRKTVVNIITRIPPSTCNTGLLAALVEGQDHRLHRLVPHK